MDVLPLRGIIGNPFGIDALVAVFPAVLEADIVVQHGLDEAIEAQPIAQAVEHGKGDPVLPVGHVQHMVVGNRAADHAGLFALGHRKRQVVVGVVIKAPLPHKGGPVIGQALEGLVHRPLQQVPADSL